MAEILGEGGALDLPLESGNQLKHVILEHLRSNINNNHEEVFFRIYGIYGIYNNIFIMI
jgi:hypothetical protein